MAHTSQHRSVSSGDAACVARGQRESLLSAPWGVHSLGAHREHAACLLTPVPTWPTGRKYTHGPPVCRWPGARMVSWASSLPASHYPGWLE